MAQLSMRTAARPERAGETLSAAAAMRVILALSAVGWCALLGALVALA